MGTQLHQAYDDAEELLKHNEYDEIVTKALMEAHSDDWSMEVIREAALIATNTMLPLIHSREIEALNQGRRLEVDLLLNHDLHDPIAGPCPDDCVERLALVRKGVHEKQLQKLKEQTEGEGR